MLLEMAIGDAYGAGFEFKPLDFVNKYNDLTAYHPHGLALDGPSGPRAGLYTDDTQMTLGIMEALLLRSDRTAPSMKTVIAHWIECYQRDPRVGYSKRLQPLLADSKTPDDFLASAGEPSEGSGAPMRAIPCGLVSFPYYNSRYFTQAVAETTHNTENGVASAMAVAAVAHALAFIGSSYPNDALLSTLKAYCQDEKFKWSTDWEGGVVNTKASNVTRAALTALRSSTSMSEILRTAVSYGGDVDTVAAIALGLASLKSDVKNDLPRFLYEGLENGPYGRVYLQLVDRLFAVRFTDR
jgi:ADP-ribosyl-[dinitrogen reductase] hydrolase